MHCRPFWIRDRSFIGLNIHCITVLLLYVFPKQLARNTDKHEKKFSNLTTPSSSLVKEGATDDQEEGQLEGNTEFAGLEDVANVGSEMERVHIAEKNKAMAAKLKVPKFTNLTKKIDLVDVLWTKCPARIISTFSLC